MFLFHQSISFRAAKDLNLFKDNEEALKFFEENKSDMTKQDEIIKILSELNLNTALPDALDLEKLYDKQIKEIYNDLYRMGVLPT